jgi:hypothetical protein
VARATSVERHAATQSSVVATMGSSVVVARAIVVAAMVSVAVVVTVGHATTTVH